MGLRRELTADEISNVSLGVAKLPIIYFSSNYPFIHIVLNRKMGSLIEESLEVLDDKTLTIDTDIMLKKVNDTPRKSLQDGLCAIDMRLQLGILKILKKFLL